MYVGTLDANETVEEEYFLHDGVISEELKKELRLNVIWRFKEKYQEPVLYQYIVDNVLGALKKWRENETINGNNWN